MASYPFNDKSNYSPLQRFGSGMADRRLSPTQNDKNYNYIAFSNENELKSSDLNEYQENLYVDRTLMAQMINSWSFYQGEQMETNTATQSVFRGKTNTVQPDSKIQVGGPFWDGATPITPKTGESNQIITNPIREKFRPTMIQITESSTKIKIVFRDGYYYTSMRSGSHSDDGFKQFVHLDTINKKNLFELTLDKQSTGITVVGLRTDRSFIYPQTSNYSGSDSDPSLTVNNRGTARQKTFFTNASYYHIENPGTGDFRRSDPNSASTYNPENCANTTSSWEECKDCVNNSSSPTIPRILCDQYLKLHLCWLKHKVNDPDDITSPYCSNICENCVLGGEFYYKGQYASGCKCDKPNESFLDGFSPVFYIDYINKQVRYMNNLLLATIT